MTFWQPGMRCVCIVDEWNFQSPTNHDPIKGQVYTVAAVHLWRKGTLTSFGTRLSADDLALRLAETGEVWYSSEAFRPLSETRLDQFRKHLNRIPTDRVPA